MKELMFWQEAKNLAYTGEVDSKLPPREFPSTDNVHYFHPMAWVRQMKLMEEERASWVDYLFQEYKTYKGIKENKSPLKERISEYHNSSTAKGRTYSTAWCASFVSWCFEQAGYKEVNSGSNSFAFDWAPEGNELAKKKSESLSTPDPNLTGWSEGEKCEPFVGAVIVLSYSHCAIIVGKNSRLNRYVYIGGNQGKGIQEIKYGTVTIGNEYAIMKPKKYNVQSYELPELNKNEDGSYATTH